MKAKTFLFFLALSGVLYAQPDTVTYEHCQLMSTHITFKKKRSFSVSAPTRLLKELAWITEAQGEPYDVVDLLEQAGWRLTQTDFEVLQQTELSSIIVFRFNFKRPRYIKHERR